MPARRSVLALVVLAFVSVTRPSPVAAQCGPASPLLLVPPGECDIPSVTPDGEPVNRSINSTGHTATFWVQNVGGAAGTFELSCWGTNSITCTGLMPASVSLGPGAQTQVTAWYSAGAGGHGELWLQATGSSEVDHGVYFVTVGAPLVDTTPYNWRKQDYARCVQACFAATHAQGTVPYFSLDAPRSVVLAYNGDRLNPKPFVHVNVSPDPGDVSLTEYRLQVRINGAFVTFLNGEQTLRFAKQTNAPVRIGGQWSSTLATGLYDMEVHVSGLYGGALRTNLIRTKLLQVNETQSPIAKGWTLLGVQRRIAVPYGVVVIEGDGSVVHFQDGIGGPPGEFSKLVAGARVYPDSTKIVFDAAGRMTEVRDRFNNVTTIVYDGSGRVSQIKDPLNLAITLTYDANGLTAIQDPGGRVTDIVVNASRRLTAITDPDNVGTAFGYDANDRLSTITNRRGHTATLTYDSQSGKLANVTPPAVEVVNADGSITTASPITTFEPWHKKGVPYGGTGIPVAAPLADTVYARVTDPGGHVVRFMVNRWGAPQETRDTLGFITTITYDSLGLPRRVVYPTGVKDSMAYNSSGLPTYARAAGQDSATYIRYAGWAQPDSVWGFQRPSRRDSIGPNGRVVFSRSRVGGQTTVTWFRYDTRGRVDSVTDGEGHLAARTWFGGVNGNRSKDSLPGGRVTTYGYDSYGRPTSVSAPGLSTRTTTYDLLNRVLQESTAGLPAIFYAYDSLFLRTVTDPKGQVYGFTRNAIGWLTVRIDPVGKADTMRYDRHGLLRKLTNRRLQTVSYAYDAGHRLTSKSGTNTDSVAWTYSANGMIFAASTPWAVDSQFFDSAGAVDSVRGRLGTQTFVQRFRYLPGGQLDSVAITGGGITFLGRKYVWDTESGALSQIRLGSGGSTTLETNRDFLPSATTFPGGDQVSHAYSSVHNEAEISTTAGYAETTTRYVGFDLARRIWRQINADGANGWQFSYDGLGRITAAHPITWDSGPEPPEGCDGTEIINENGQSCVENWGQGSWIVLPGGSEFSYDSVGNRRDLNGGYGPGNRIRAFNSCTYTTDSLGDGNVLSRTCGTEVIRFHWDADSRLTALKVVDGDSLDFRYDAAGRLVRRDVNTSPQSYFLWQGDNLLAELNGSANGKTSEYSHRPGLDNPHAVIVGTTPYFAHQDAIGNVIALTDSATNVKRTYAWGTWGSSTGGTDYGQFANADRARFKGALWLGPQVDLYYMRARWYEPRSGRFLSEDPAGLGGGLNPYAYASNDPVNGWDPTGMCTWYYVEERSVTVITYPSGRRETVYGPWEVVGMECRGGPSVGGIGGDLGGGGRDDGEEPDEPRCGTGFSLSNLGFAAGAFIGDARSMQHLGHQVFPGRTNSAGRHTWASYWLTRRWGGMLTRAAGIANEVYGLIRFDLPDLPGRLSGERDWAFQAEDLLNNERGIAAARVACRQ